MNARSHPEIIEGKITGASITYDSSAYPHFPSPSPVALKIYAYNYTTTNTNYRELIGSMQTQTVSKVHIQFANPLSFNAGDYIGIAFFDTLAYVGILAGSATRRFIISGQLTVQC